MSDQWSNCAVTFPGDFREVHGCTVERQGSSLIVTVPGGVVEPVISAIDALPRRMGKAFPITVSCFGGQHAEFPECALKGHDRGWIPSDAGVHIGAEVRPHVFTFHCK